VETLTYNYTIRGWLKGINRNYANSGSGGNWFGIDLSYDYGFNASQINGNVAGEVWMSKGDPVSRAYGFIYDNTNRLLTGDYTQNDGSGYVKDPQVDFNVDSLTYDANGNILLMQQKGVQINSSTVIDHLVYSYLQPGGWSNKLANVIDNSGNTAPLGDYQQGTNTGNDFSYDGNGNMVVDSNKEMEGVVYNILNLPQLVPMKGKGTISYVYDADGNKLEKLVVDSTISQTNPLKDTTLYSGMFVYNNDSLQFIGHEEGRIRPKLINPTGGWVSSNIEYVYDYFIKDHLGNTRMVLSEETEEDSYVATMEPQNATLENEIFDSVASTQYPKPAGFDSDTANHYVSMLDASSSGGTRIGPMIILKVMAGDTITASTYCWYNTPVQVPTGPSLLSSLVPALAGGSVAVGSEGLLAEQSSIQSILTSNLPTFLSYKDGQYVNTSPKAFLNWALFDDRFNYVTGGVTQVPVIASGNPSVAITANTPVSIPKNGYIYIYVSNESPQPVYFDNVSIQDHRGPLLEENHYYPFGLTMAGISDKTLKTDYAENKYRYNGKDLQHQEFSDGTGLDEYDFGARFQDPQLGVWHNIDPLAEKSRKSSPYAYAYNNPLRFIDPDGMLPMSGHVETDAEQSMDQMMEDIDADQNQLVNYVTLTNTKTGDVTTYILGNADEDETDDEKADNKSNDINDMHMSDDGIGFLKKAEGHRDKVYRDQLGFATVGWGHALKGKELEKYKDGDEVPMETQEALFKADIADAEAAVKRRITNGDISQSQFDALVDLAFNTGSVGHTISEYVNAGKYNDAWYEFSNYNKNQLPALDNRRANEQRLFGDGNYNYDWKIHTTFWPMTNPHSKFYIRDWFTKFKAQSGFISSD
jgi:RHS repeat-associated protein